MTKLKNLFRKNEDMGVGKYCNLCSEAVDQINKGLKADEVIVITNDFNCYGIVTHRHINVLKANYAEQFFKDYQTRVTKAYEDRTIC
jgi:hypothetical protein